MKKCNKFLGFNLDTVMTWQKFITRKKRWYSVAVDTVIDLSVSFFVISVFIYMASFVLKGIF